MLRRIRINGYKSFHGLDLTLGAVAVVIGPNGAGKSNLLDAIQLVSGFVTQPSLQEAFDGHRGLPLESMWYGEHGFDGLREQESVRCRFGVDVELSESVLEETERTIAQKRHGLDTERDGARQRVLERLLRHEIEIELLPRTGVLRVVDERVQALKSDLTPKANRVAFLERVDGQLRLRMEGQGRPSEFPLGLDHTIMSTSLYEPHYPHVTALRREMSRWRTYYLEPRTLMREDVPVSEVRGIGPRGENLAAYLNTLKNQWPSSFDSFRRAVGTIMPNRPEIDVALTKEGMVGLKVTEATCEFSGRLISEGTLRLLGLLAAVHPDSPATLVGYEEPENGVHPARIRTIADIMHRACTQYGKQLLVTTHSPLLATSFPRDSWYACRREGPGSVIEPLGCQGPLLAEGDVEEALSEAMIRGDFGG
ncbi:MAG: AAA family ATPase [Candidatus Brocadiaceae bacterium]|nr:AAA family ATPase [Candidatus Brocadiaceae bacterium]